MDYELYHDESQEYGYWHGILLVPLTTKEFILNHLKQIRDHTGYTYPLSFKNIKKFNKVFDCAEAWLDFAIGSLITKFSPNFPYQVFTGEKIRGRKQYTIFDYLVNSSPLGAKFILFRDRDKFKYMKAAMGYGVKMETSFRIGLTGGLHYLFSEVDPVRVVKMHFDGYEHYGRGIDQIRIINRIKGLRDYCKFEDSYIVDDRSSDHEKQKCQDHKDCQLLQLSDLLIGSFRTAFGFLGQGKREEQKALAEPVKELIKRYQQGYARMKNSRWRNSFCMSESFIEDDTWQFRDIEFKASSKDQQLPLFQ